METFRIYVVTNLINGKYYIGQTRLSLSDRWSNHCSCAERGDDYYFYRAILKHGKENFVIEQLAEAYTVEEINRLETLWIILTRSYDRNVGYNGTFGGDRPKQTPETLAKIQAALPRGENHHYFGKRLPEHVYEASRRACARLAEERRALRPPKRTEEESRLYHLERTCRAATHPHYVALPLNEIIDLYTVFGVTDIGKMYGVSKTPVRNRLKEAGIKLRPPHRQRKF